MVDRDALLELVPHYIAMVVLVLVIMTVIRRVFELDNLIIEFALILVLVFSYRPLILRLDFVPTPEIWETAENE